MQKTRLLLLLLATAAPRAGAAGQDHRPAAPVVENVTPARTIYFSLADVRLLDGPFKHAAGLNAAWMLELDADRLLSNFRANAGLPRGAEPYDGWEAMGIAGHTLGHYLSAASQHYAATGDARFKERVDHIVAGLDACQSAFVNGFIGGMPGGDKVFKEVKKGIIRSRGFDLNGLWVPWYNEHKTMMGLNDAYLLAGNERAKSVLVNLADYLVDVISGLTRDEVQRMLDCEYGGMNEALAQVYALTGERKYLDASYAFYQDKLQDKLAAGIDALQGLHSNTQIPKLVGSARQHELTGNERDRAIAEFAWHTLVHHHSYANGGNSMGEYLFLPDKLNNRLGANTCETCNTYNMLKLTRHLYEWTGDPAYVDYHERALYNHILASQHPVDGRVCYFLSLGMGTRKDFGSKENNFSCCMGSGFENHSKYGGAIYSHDPGHDTLRVNLYIPSTLAWNERNVALSMETTYPEGGKINIRVEESPRQTFALDLRYPAWATSGATVKVNGTRQPVATGPGSFITIRRAWKRGDRVEVDFPMSLHAVAMPDNPDRRAVFYGPTLLAGTFGERAREQGDVPVFISDAKDVTGSVKRLSERPLAFAAMDSVAMIPFYKVHDQYQTVYWDVYTPAGWEAIKSRRAAELERLALLDRRTLDFIKLGEMQPERDHRLDGDNTRVGEGHSRKYRMAYENGWFSFDMRCGHDRPAQLILTYHGGESRKYAFDLVIDDWTTSVHLSGEGEEFIEHVVDVPETVTSGKESVKITLRAGADTRVSNVYDCRLVKKQ
ncbi:MAG: glycoside hydrolase family 127 protein [Odoribacteraceae bacterium]|jgi:DUF1680 family protein|nr:glycoside hydrolase family 127 protein [Odoribacteraceae bacterium]